MQTGGTENDGQTNWQHVNVRDYYGDDLSNFTQLVVQGTTPCNLNVQ